MEYFLSHVGTIFIAGLIVAIAAVTWWALTTRNEYLIRKRAIARREAMEAKRKEQETQEHNKN